MVLIEVTEAEARTRVLMAPVPDRDRTSDTIIKAAFRACYSYAMTPDRIMEIGGAIVGIQNQGTGDDLKKILSAMVRAGLLRSRKAEGVRLYEVNY